MARTCADHREKIRTRRVSPRVKLAARLYATGAVPTKAAAADAAGLARGTFYVMSAPGGGSPEVQNMIGEADRMIEDRTVQLSAAIALLARKALKKVGQLVDSNNEHVSLKASVDLLDRNPETSKIQRHQVTSFNIDHEDTKDLVAALVAGAKVREKYSDLAKGDVVRVDLGPSAVKEIAVPTPVNKTPASVKMEPSE